MMYLRSDLPARQHRSGAFSAKGDGALSRKLISRDISRGRGRLCHLCANRRIILPQDFALPPKPAFGLSELLGVITPWEEMAVGVQRHLDGGMAKPLLHH